MSEREAFHTFFSALTSRFDRHRLQPHDLDAFSSVCTSLSLRLPRPFLSRLPQSSLGAAPAAPSRAGSPKSADTLWASL